MKYKHLLITIAISIVFFGVFLCKYKTYANTYAETLSTIEQNGKFTNEFIARHATVINDSTFLINDVVLETFDKRQETIEKLLDLQFERLQSEQSLLEIWTALITIVFLVFSFYSFFHTDELVKKASEDAEEIQKRLTVSNEIRENFKKQLKKIYEPIAGELEEGKEIVKKANELSNYYTRLESVEENSTQISRNKNDIDELRADIDKLQKVIIEMQTEDAPYEEDGSNYSENA